MMKMLIERGAINIFFFKQKTAYEMRISDWSSDVCSSDLPGPVPTGFTHFAMIAPLAPQTLIVTLGLEPRVQGKRLNTRSGPRFALADARLAGVTIRVGR